MTFNTIDIENWSRKEHFQHYYNNVRCAYSLTVPIDITGLYHRLKSEGLKAYPVQIYMLATVVNQFPAFRMSLDEGGRLGYWESADPAYTVLNAETETFSVVYSRYQAGFRSFYEACLADINQYGTGALAPQGDIPSNSFNVSSVPWLDFTAFNLNLYTEGTYLLPIFTIGRYIEADGKIQMPLAIQVHHAVCDGFHVGKFVESLRNMAENHTQWL